MKFIQETHSTYKNHDFITSGQLTTKLLYITIKYQLINCQKIVCVLIVCYFSIVKSFLLKMTIQDRKV